MKTLKSQCEGVMDFGALKEMIAVIKTEQQRRASLLPDEDPEAADAQWLFEDRPFINDLCLMVLVTLWHQVERELVGLAARAADDGEVIDGRRYREQVGELRKGRGWDWNMISARLSLGSCERYASMEAIHLLANSYKHDPSLEPSEDLKKFLKLPKVNYAPLPESDLVRERLAAFVGLGTEADYCEIAVYLVEIAEKFVKSVEGQAKLSRVKWEPASMNPADFAH